MSDERGQAGGIEVLAFSLLVMVGGLLVMVNAWGVVDARFAADTAAREAVRWVAEAAADDRAIDDLRTGATLVAGRSLGSRHRSRPVIEVEAPDGHLLRCARVRVTVRLEVDALAAPFVGGFGGPVVVTASHDEIVDPARSGVGGPATCIR